MFNYDIVIIDSGVSKNSNDNPCGISVESVEGGFAIGNTLTDEVGHGTIINSLISKKIPQNRIFNVRLSGSVDEVNEDMLIAALSYINEHVICRVINVSLGVRFLDKGNQLYSVCRELFSKGVIIVSAFDNAGCLSYPAAFDCVIGVDNSSSLRNPSEFDYVENSPINILAKGNVQRLRLDEDKVVLVGGSSIACAHISAIVASNETPVYCLQDALILLKAKARRIYASQHQSGDYVNTDIHISVAIVFPFSKEAQAFLRFSDQLPFKIKAFYDVRESGKVGRKLSSYYEGANTAETIKNIDNVDFSGVDTIILGHLDELNALCGRNYKEKLIHQAIKEKIQIYSFDPLQTYSELFSRTEIKRYYPIITKNDLPENTFGKLYKISKPVVGIFGTSSHQGKFSLQLALKSQLSRKGYNIGTLGTEPHSPLFGFDVVFPMGYNSTVYLEYNEIVQYINNKINNLCLEGKELILTSSQAQVIPYYCNNLLEFPSLQYFFAVGTKPDAVILCVNYFDEISYIRNSLYTLIGLTDATVLALVMYPITYSSEWGGIGTSKRNITDEEFSKRARELEDEFHTPVYLLGDEDDLSQLSENIIDFF